MNFYHLLLSFFNYQSVRLIHAGNILWKLVLNSPDIRYNLYAMFTKIRGFYNEAWRPLHDFPTSGRWMAAGHHLCRFIFPHCFIKVDM